MKKIKQKILAGILALAMILSQLSGAGTLVAKASEATGDEVIITGIEVPNTLDKTATSVDVVVKGTNLPEEFSCKTQLTWDDNGTPVEDTGSYKTVTAKAGGSETERTVTLEVKPSAKAISWLVTVRTTDPDNRQTQTATINAKTEGTTPEPTETPVIESISYDVTSLPSTGGDVVATVTGKKLLDLEISSGNVYCNGVVDTGIFPELGTETDEIITIEFTLPENKTETAKVYKCVPCTSSWQNVNVEGATGVDSTITVAAAEAAPSDPVTEETAKVLEDAIAEASTLKESDYTVESWKAYKAAVDAAKALTSDDTNTDYLNAINAINAAYAKLVKKPVKVSSLNLYGAPSTKIGVGKGFSLKANVAPANADNKGVIWSSSNPKYASVSANGYVKTYKAGKGKYVTITAVSADGSASTSFKFKIMKGYVKSVKVTGKKTVKAGKSLKLKAKVNATSGASKKVVWTSSNPKLATVSASGKVKTFKGKKGKVKITATATDGSNKKKTVTIKIK